MSLQFGEGWKIIAICHCWDYVWNQLSVPSHADLISNVYVKVEIIYKQNLKEIALRKIISINKNVKDIINKDKIYNKNYRLKNDRDYSNFDWTSLYANIF